MQIALCCLHQFLTNMCAVCSDFGVEDKLLGYAERGGISSLRGSVPGVWGKLKKLYYL
jgi:hypothetical protein